MKHYSFSIFILSVFMMSISGTVGCKSKSEQTPELAAAALSEDKATENVKEETPKKEEAPEAVLEQNSDSDKPSEDTSKTLPALEPAPGWPKTNDEVAEAKDISDFSKYAYAIYRALGCSLAETPADVHANAAIFDVHSLEDCSKTRDDSLLKLLVAQKTDIQAYNADGRTLLSLSLYHSGSDYELQKETEVFDMLIQSGADITKPNADGSTILMETEFIETAEKYLSAGGDVQAKDKQGKTALDHQKTRLDLMVNGKKFEGNTFPYFFEEPSMLCQNEDEIKNAKAAGKDAPKCMTYADIMKDNIRKIIERIEKV